MALIPDFQNTLKNKIDAVEIEVDDPRPYLGMSSIGEECERKLWLGFHWSTTRSITARVNRIFRDGHAAEAKMISDLKSVGVECFFRFDGEKEEMFGLVDEKQECFSDVAGHFKGHCDGRALNVPEAPKTEHLIEMKTHNEKYFNELKKKKVKESHPKHYAQMQIYMKKAKLKRALYIAYNKNTSEYYFERVYYDKDFANELLAKAASIIMSEEIPHCKYKSTWYSCKWCEYRGICFEGERAQRNCRTCEKSDICNDGKWECRRQAKELSYDEQLIGCRYHKYGWGL